MKKPRFSPFITRPSLWAVSFCLVGSHASAELVAKWQAADFNSVTEQWPSSVGSITAFVQGASYIESIADAFNGKPALEFPGGTYFRVLDTENPLAGATAMTMVAVFEPQVAGASGGSWWQSTGIVGMEQGGSVPDWGFGLNGERINAGIGGPDVTMFSNPVNMNQVYVAVFTWNNSGVQRLFVNGVEVDSDVGVAVDPRNPGAFAIGAITSDGSNPFVGLISEVQLHNSDESANAAALSMALLEEYAVVGVRSLKVSLDGATMVLVDGGSQIDPAGSFTVEVDNEALPPEAISVTKVGGVTTITVMGGLNPASTYFYYIDIPLIGGGRHDVSGSFQTPRLAQTLPGPEGSVGTWGIRELKGSHGNDISTVQAALLAATDPETYVDGTAPVLNHSDPDTNGPASVGDFNNDFPILSDEEGDQDWVVSAKTKVNIPAAGTYTFAIRSDDGFAMRVSGAGGGRFIASHGPGILDPGDNQTLLFDGGTGDSNTRGVYEFDAAGVYDITYLGWDGGGGGFHEVAWAPGTFADPRDTNTWTLVGNPTHPSIPPFRPRYVANPPGPLGTANSFGVRTFLQATGLGDLLAVSNFLATTERVPGPGDTLTVDGQIAYLSVNDPQNSGGRGALPFPGNTPADDDNVVSVVKGRIFIPTAGYHTFFMEADDGGMLRIKGTGGNPNPSFKRVTGGGNRTMSNPNEMFFDAPTGNTDTRGIINLAAGYYDIEFIHQELGGGFNYVVTSAAGEWPHGTTPPTGFQPLGLKPLAEQIIVPHMKGDWRVESSTPNRPEFTFSIGGARAAINATLAVYPPIPNAISFWPAINFTDPETNATAGHHNPSIPWPLNTPNDDNDYAMRADGVLVITTPGEYHLGFQGDDGGYMYIDGLNGLATPSWLGVAHSNHLAQVRIEELVPDSGIRNALVLEIGTGNSRTLGRVNLQAGEYRIRTLMYEGGGGSWWEVIGSKGDVGSPAAFVYPLLAKGTADTTIRVYPGLSLADPSAIFNPGETLEISGLTVSGSPVSSVAFNFSSTEGKTYTVEASLNLQSWILLNGSLPATGASTPFSINPTTNAQLNGQPKVFFRVREN